MRRGFLGRLLSLRQECLGLGRSHSSVLRLPSRNCVRPGGSLTPSSAAKVKLGLTAAQEAGAAMLVMVEFPASGCWEVTGAYKGQTLTFVVNVGP